MARGAVLDFDGVIVESMGLHAEAYRRVLSPFGVAVRDEDVFLREGARSETLIRDLLAVSGQTVDEETVRRLAHEKQGVYARLGPPRPYPGAEPLVRGLRRVTRKLGLVTGTRRENVTRLIPTLEPLFDAILAQDSYQHDKPHPEPYERTAKALSTLPKKLAALENAVRGVESAKAAGYGFVVAIPTTLAPARLAAAGADVVARDHAEALRCLREWLVPR